MKISFRQFRKTLREASLSKHEQLALREQLVDFIANHPSPSVSRGDFLFFNSIMLRRSFAIGALAILLVLSGSGISYAAENSLPGGILYPVKINVLEPIRGALAVSPEAKTQWEVAKVERRLNEAEQMLGKGSFTAEAGTDLSEQIQDHSNAIAQGITELKAQDNIAAAASVSNGFTAALQAHADLLQELAKKSKNPDNAQQLLTTIELNTETSHDEIESIANDVSDDASPDTKNAANAIAHEADQTISEAHKLFDRSDRKLDDSSKQQLDQYLKQVDSLRDQAQQATKTDHYSDAFVLFQEAQRKAIEAKTVISAKKELKTKTHIQLKPELQTVPDESSKVSVTTDDPEVSIEVLSTEGSGSGHGNKGRGSRIRRLLPENMQLNDIGLDLKGKDKEQD